MRTVAWMSFWLAMLLLLSGGGQCQYTAYKIDMKPVGNEMERTLGIEQKGDEQEKPVVDAALLSRIAALYESRLTPPDARIHRFRDRFLSRTPADVGGAGRYLRLGSLLGSASVYSERFRGMDDRAGRLKTALEAADKLLDYLIGWMDRELGEHPGREKLHHFLDDRFRHDVHNVIVYAGLAEQLFDIHERGTEEMLVRLAHYLVERNYLAVEDLPALVSSLFRAEVDQQATEFMGWIRRRVAGWMGIEPSAPVPAALDFLLTQDQADASFSAYLKTTPGFQRSLKEWEAKKTQQPGVPAPQPMGLLLDPLLMDIVAFEVGPEDKVSVSLHLPVRPFATNGSWDEKTASLDWTDKPIRGKAGLPAFCYAAWGEPDEAFQRKHLGRVMLRDEKLAEYVLWRNGLTPGEGQAWDDFLRTLRPGPEWSGKLGAFRFPGERVRDQEGAPAASLADAPRRLLLTP